MPGIKSQKKRHFLTFTVYQRQVNNWEKPVIFIDRKHFILDDKFYGYSMFWRVIYIVCCSGFYLFYWHGNPVNRPLPKTDHNNCPLTSKGHSNLIESQKQLMSIIIALWRANWDSVLGKSWYYVTFVSFALMMPLLGHSWCWKPIRFPASWK